MPEPASEFTISMEQVHDYEFRVSFGEAPDLVMDEPEPLGAGAGPGPSQLLAAAVANCLCASLLFCARKARLEPGRIRAEITTAYARNENGRLRIGAMRVRLDPGFADPAKAQRCLSIFEDFCIVSQSVRQGIPIEVEVLKRR